MNHFDSGKQVAALAVTAFSVMGLTAAASAQQVLDYTMPAAWDGVSLVVTDQSPAGNDASLAGTPVLSAAIPPGASGGTMSLDSTGGGFQTTATGLLTNAIVSDAGGFEFSASFMWDGGDTTRPAQKIIDYAGTESLQLENFDFTGGTADLRFNFNDGEVGPVVPIVANTWYDVVATFTATDAIQVDGSLPGTADLSVDGATPVSVALSKTTAGDDLNRPIGIGTFAIASGIVNLSGNIYDPSVSLLSVPEPASALAFFGLGNLLLLRRRQ